MLTTTTLRKPAKKKNFAWSYSKLKNYETCPKRYYHVDIIKEYVETSEALTWGNKVHDCMAEHMASGKPLPTEMKPFGEWAEEAVTLEVRGEKIDVRNKGAKLLVEQQLAITEDLKPCAWFAPETWYRAKVDLLWVLGPVGGAIDWKTGRVETESPQLALAAACMFIHYPQLQAIRSRYIFLKEDACTDLDIKRSDLPMVWDGLNDRIAALKHAHDTNQYPPNPNRLCERWCPVKSCKYNGKNI